MSKYNDRKSTPIPMGTNNFFQRKQEEHSYSSVRTILFSPGLSDRTEYEEFLVQEAKTFIDFELFIICFSTRWARGGPREGYKVQQISENPSH